MVGRRSLFRIFVLGTLLLTLAPPSGIVHAADCSGSPACKKYYQWDGGTIGAYQKMDIYSWLGCYMGCSWVQKGMWVKYNPTGTYIFAGIEKTQTTYLRYLYTIYQVSNGVRYYYITDVSFNDVSLETQVYREPSGNPMRVMFRSENLYIDYITPVTETLWDVIQIGTRMSAISGSAEIPYYNSREHWWRCGCNGVWYYQSNDGNPFSQGNAFTINQAWQVPPHVPGSNGGTYESWCDYPNCP